MKAETHDVVLVIDDQPLARASLALPLRGRFEVVLAATVREALDALRRLTPAVVVLDLLLDAPAAALHREILLRGLPVVVVSGIEGDAAQAIARVWGAPALLKPVADADLNAAVAAALETRTMPDADRLLTPDPLAPDAQAPVSRVTGVTAPTQTQLPAPPSTPADIDSVSPLAATHPAVAIAEVRYRTMRRIVASVGLTGLAVLFELRGHTMPVALVVGLTALGIGLSGLEAALRKRPAVAAGGAAGLALLALGGTALGLDEANTIATLGAGAIPVVGLLADRVRGA